MTSFNFIPFNFNPFKDPKPDPFPHFPPFAAISIPNPFKKQPDPEPDPVQRPKPGIYKAILEQFYWETENRPDYRHTPEVEAILNQNPFVETKENPTREEIEENEAWWKGFKENPVVKFLIRAEEVKDELNEMELKENENPYRYEDRKFWKSIPNVYGLDGRPMPRRAIKSKKESDDKFWDFAKQFFFGLWGFRQRPYPRGRPIDVAQAVGYKRLEKRYYDCKFFVKFTV